MRSLVSEASHNLILPEMGPWLRAAFGSHSISAYRAIFVAGPLNVTCQGGSALINFKTKTAFAGRVYVKGAYAKPQCNRDFSYASNNESALEMPLGDCGGERDKVVSSGTVPHSV